MIVCEHHANRLLSRADLSRSSSYQMDRAAALSLWPGFLQLGVAHTGGSARGTVTNPVRLMIVDDQCGGSSRAAAR